jgi:uncharacterized membrane protein YeaQ/YmgE (transglycosylase-associated protein family)
MYMSIVAWLVVGLIAGWIANMIMSNGSGGLIADLVLGVFGALLGGFLLGLVTGVDYTTGINIPTILVSIGGAIILIGAYRMINGSRMRT